MLKKLFIIGLLFIAAAIQAAAQEEPDTSPVKWSLATDRLSERLNKDDKFNAFLSAKIEAGWHLYALEKVEGGPIATRISIAEELPFELGKIEAPKPIEVEDSAFGVTTKFYEDSVKFTLPIKVTQSADGKLVKLQIRVRFQICNDEMCLPPTTVTLGAESEKAIEVK